MNPVQFNTHEVTVDNVFNQIIMRTKVPWNQKLFTNHQFIKTIENIEQLCTQNSSLLVLTAHKLIMNLLNYFKLKKYDDLNFNKNKLTNGF